MHIIRYVDQDGASGLGHEHADGTVTRLQGELLGQLHDSGTPVRITRRLAPLVPVAILGIGRNYRAHAEEQNAEVPRWPVIFMKMPSAVQHPGAPIVLPRVLESRKVDYEGELAVVIGQRCHNVARADALSHVLGYTCANDVSARDWQKHGGGGQWCRGKTFATFCPLGPRLVTADEIPDPGRLHLRTELNGEVVQDAPTADMIFDVATLIEFASGSTILEPGTVILTGTPAGVGFARTPPVFLRDGDTVAVTIDGIGTLENPVAEERVDPGPQ